MARRWGLPYGFASHFAPALLDEALAIYRHQFQPSPYLDQPYVMVACNVFAADTEEEARLLASSQQQSFLALRSGRPSRFPPPVEGYFESLPNTAQVMLSDVQRVAAIGTSDQVRDSLRALLARTQADEIIISSAIFDPDARKHSVTIAAEAFRAATT